MAISKFVQSDVTTQAEAIKLAGDAIVTFVNGTLAAETMTAVKACYSGDAATAYEEAFKNAATAVTDAISSIVTEMDAAIAQESADYAAKQSQMVSSVQVPTLGN